MAAKRGKCMPPFLQRIEQWSIPLHPDNEMYTLSDNVSLAITHARGNNTVCVNGDSILLCMCLIM